MSENVLVAIVVGVPLLALVVEHAMGPGISERHHMHHDTYSVSIAFIRALVIAMLFMGGVGLILSWLCKVGVFSAQPTIVLSFFSAFLTVCFALWFCVWRYRVVTYDTYLVVTPFVGRRIRVDYADITELKWLSTWQGTITRSVRVYVGGKRAATLWGALDTDEILMRIDRYEVLS